MLRGSATSNLTDLSKHLHNSTLPPLPTFTQVFWHDEANTIGMYPSWNVVFSISSLVFSELPISTHDSLRIGVCGTWIEGRGGGERDLLESRHKIHFFQT